MGLKKRSKVNAEFSMSSLTDIIFLLLIFFMLTSSLVIPNALNLKLPGKNNKNTPPSKEQPNIVAISSSGKYTWNGSSISARDIEKRVRDIKKSKGKFTLILSPSGSAPNESVVAIMDVAYRWGIDATLVDPK